MFYSLLYIEMIAKKKKIEYIMKTNTYAVYLYGSAFSVRIIFSLK